jgi:hypothetical protein
MIFDDNWLKDARARGSNGSWVDEVIKTLDTTGQIYLSTLGSWFDKYPLNAGSDRDHLRARLENFQDNQHLAGVNELTWWAFMQHDGINGCPLPTSSTPRPDFQLQAPADCFIEVSTVNVSQSDKAKFGDGNSVKLDHAETIRRFIGKLTDEKEKQLAYASDCKKPAALALFDYTEWSGFGTQFNLALGDALLGEKCAFASLTQKLSAIIYLERRVLCGRIALSRHRSTIYYNPRALYPLPQGAFGSLTKFSFQTLSIQSIEPWLYL